MHHSPVAEPHIKGIIPSRRKAPDLLSCSTSATKRSGSFSGDSRTQHVRCLLCFIGCLPVWQKKTISAYCLCTTAKHFSSSGTLYLFLSKRKHLFTTLYAMHFHQARYMPAGACSYVFAADHARFMSGSGMPLVAASCGFITGRAWRILPG